MACSTVTLLTGRDLWSQAGLTSKFIVAGLHYTNQYEVKKNVVVT